MTDGAEPVLGAAFADEGRRSAAVTAVSVIVPVCERPHDLSWLYRTYSAEFSAVGRPYEFIFVVEPWAVYLVESLQQLIDDGEPIRILELGQVVGESELLAVAASTCSSPIIVTMPSYPRIQPGGLEKLVQGVEAGEDLASAARSFVGSSVLNRTRNRLFHAILRRTVGGAFKDVASGVRAVRKSVFDDLPLYGDFFRYLPLLAQRQGYTVVEHVLEQHPEDRRARGYSMGIYLRRMIDLLGLFFLLRFTYKPLRFFGLVGTGLSFTGSLILAVLFMQRIGGRGIADRPLLLLGVMLLVLGVQAIAMGLIGEIIVHLNASHQRTYRLKHADEHSSGVDRS